MKKLFAALAVPALALGLTTGAVASASAIEPQQEVQDFSNLGIETRDKTVTLFLNSEMELEGADFRILYGSNVVKLTGNKLTAIGVGSAQVAAYKSNGTVNGVYTIIVKK